MGFIIFCIFAKRKGLGKDWMSSEQHAFIQLVTTPLNDVDNGSGECVTGMIWKVVGKVGCMVSCRISGLGIRSVLALEEVVAEVSLCGRVLFDVGIKFTD